MKKEHGKATSRYAFSKWFESLSWCKKVDDTGKTVATKGNPITKTFGKRFAIPLDLDFFRDPIYPSGLKGKFWAWIKFDWKGEFM